MVLKIPQKTQMLEREGNRLAKLVFLLTLGLFVIGLAQLGLQSLSVPTQALSFAQWVFKLVGVASLLILISVAVLAFKRSESRTMNTTTSFFKTKTAREGLFIALSVALLLVAIDALGWLGNWFIVEILKKSEVWGKFISISITAALLLWVMRKHVVNHKK